MRFDLKFLFAYFSKGTTESFFLYFSSLDGAFYTRQNP